MPRRSHAVISGPYYELQTWQRDGIDTNDPSLVTMATRVLGGMVTDDDLVRAFELIKREGGEALVEEVAKRLPDEVRKARDIINDEDGKQPVFIHAA